MVFWEPDFVIQKRYSCGHHGMVKNYLIGVMY